MNTIFKTFKITVGVAILFLPWIVDYYFPANDGSEHATLLFALVAGVNRFNVTFVPQFLVFDWNDIGRITSLNVSVGGEGGDIVNIRGANAVGLLNNISQFRSVSPMLIRSAAAGPPPVGCAPLVIPLANGLIKGKVCTIEVTVTAGAGFNCYGASRNSKGNLYVQSVMATVLANSGQQFDKFFAVLSPQSLSNTADFFDVAFSDGGSDRWEAAAVIAMNKYSTPVWYNEINPDQVGAIIDNLDKSISGVTLTPSANRDVVILRYAEKGKVMGKA